MSSQPAALGGSPSFAPGLPFARPFLPPMQAVFDRLSRSFEAGMLTNGPLLRELEESVAERLGVEHVIAVSSCTSGLILAIRALSSSGPVVLPSFTFSATAHAVTWNGIDPRFADCDTATFQVDPADVADRLDGAGALIGTHIFGAPCPVEDMEALASERGLPLVFDAAHALGALRNGRPVGSFGDAEVFSMSPTKVVVAGEGGLVATRHDWLAEAVRSGRNYGNSGDYDPRFAGLNARLSELHAALALESLALLDEHLTRRQALADRYQKGLSDLPGLAFQAIDGADRSTCSYLTVVVDEEDFGISRDDLVKALAADGIDTRCYFSPPVHRQSCYSYLAGPELSATDSLAQRAVSLPIWGDLPLEAVDRVAEVLHGLHGRAEAVTAALASARQA